MSRRKAVRLLILGTGGMAQSHVAGFRALKGVEIVGAAEIDQQRRKSFCEMHGIEHAFASLSDALSWGAFDAVANVTPDNVHLATTLQAIAGGKHVFCEKPLAMNHADADEMVAAAERAGLVGMVNLTYRNVPHIHLARELVKSGQIGSLKHVEASYLQSWLASKAWGEWRTEPKWLWRLSQAHGSNGTLGDIGIHILDFASFGGATDIARVYSRQKAFEKAENDRIGEYVLDANDSFTMSVEFANGALGVVHATRWAAGHLNELRLRLYGDKGGIEVSHSPEKSAIRVCLGEDIETVTWRGLRARAVPTNYRRFIEAVRTGQTHEPSFRRAAELQRVLDASLVSEASRCEQAAEVDAEEVAAAYAL